MQNHIPCQAIDVGAAQALAGPANDTVAGKKKKGDYRYEKDESGGIFFVFKYIAQGQKEKH